MVTCYLISLFVHAKATIRISIICKAHIQAIIHYEFLQMLDVRRSAIGIDIKSIRGIIYYICLCTKGVKHSLGYGPCCAICYIQPNFDVFESVFCKRYEISHIAITSGLIVNSLPDMLSLSKGNFQFPIDIVFDFENSVLVHLFSITIKEFDSIIVVRIVRCGNHYSTIKVIYPGNVCNGRRCSYVHNIRIGSTCY